MTEQLDTSPLVVETCPTCGVRHGIPKALMEEARKDQRKSLHCPNGHAYSYLGESEAAKLKRQLELCNQDCQKQGRMKEAARRSLAATQGVVTKLRKKIQGNGA